MIKVNGKEVEFIQFPNGETKLVEESIEKGVALMFPKISFKYQDDSDLIKLMFVKNYLDSLGGIGGETLTIYYMPYSRMDRSENNSAFTLKYIANFINYLNFERVRVVEPHSDVTPALINNVKPLYIGFDLLPIVMDSIGFNKNKDYIFFPDAGAGKRYASLKGFKQLVGHKHRDFQTGEIKSLKVVGELPEFPENSKVLIVDDLSSYGGTFLHSAKALKHIGFDKVYLQVAHAEDSIFDGQLFKTDFVDGIYTTNTILSKNGIWLNKQYDSKLTVFDIEGVLSND
jgi:ribose-phosphate pyrophosphokinase